MNSRDKQSKNFACEDKVGYILFSEEKKLLEHEMRLDINMSKQLKIENNYKTGDCFYNASRTTSKTWDYVEGFVLTEYGFFEHGWNRKTDNKLIIDVTFDTPLLHRMCLPDYSYIEVIRYSHKDIIQYLSITKGKVPFFKHLYREQFNLTKEKILTSFPKIPYIEEK